MGVRIAVQSLWTKGEPSTFVYEFDQSRVVIGRSRSADVQLPHPAVSGAHASIRSDGAGYVLIDEGSTNGTRVNETPVATGRPKKLRTQDVIDLGGYRLTIEIGVPVALTMSVRMTTDYARKMLQEQNDGDQDQEALEARFDALQRGADQSVELLPIQKGPASQPPPRPSAPPPPKQPEERPRMRTSELVVYSLAALLLATSVVAMFFLTRP